VLAFAGSGPWWEGEINIELFEAVLGYSTATGVARLLLAATAALADERLDARGGTNARATSEGPRQVQSDAAVR
jgi:hypothetical protein